MTLFIFGAALLLLITLCALLLPLLRTRAAQNAAESPALRILREQGSELEAERAAGKLSDDAYASAVSELELRVLDEAQISAAPVRHAPRRAWASALAVLLPAASAALYWKIGNLQALDPSAAAAQAQVTPDQIEEMVARLAERVKKDPNDIEGARMLGRSYMVMGRYGEAREVYQSLADHHPDAQAYADLADAVASTQERSLDGKPEQLIAQALKLDPHNVKALALAGTLSFEKKDYAKAISQWQQILVSVQPDSEFGRSVQGMIDEAKNRSGQAATPAATAPMPPTATLSAKGRVTLAPALNRQASPDDTLFIFARSEAGGPPLAGMRFTVKDLPMEFDFSQAQAMMGSVQPGQKILIGARISKHGGPIAQNGDLQGFSTPVAPDATKVEVQISEVVKR